MPITFHTADIKFSLKQKKQLKEFIAFQLHHSLPVRQAGNIPSFQLSIVFCSDEYLRAINKRFLNHDYYTDIITFPLSDDKKHIEAEIYISIERVEENAKKYKVKSEKLKGNSKRGGSPFGGQGAELHRVMFHGVLHLLGYKDKTKAQKAEMRKMEDKWLKEFAGFRS